MDLFSIMIYNLRMKNKKILLLILSTFFYINIFSQTENKISEDAEIIENVESEKKIINIGSVYGIPSIPLACIKAFSENKTENSVNPVFYENYETLITDFFTNKTDAVFLPYDFALSVMEKNPELFLCAGIIQKSGTYLISSDLKIKSFSDLLGKTVLIPKEDEFAEKMFVWFLNQYGIKINQGLRGITINDLENSSEIVVKLSNGPTTYSVLSEPYATISAKKKRHNKIVIDFQSQFNSVLGKISYFPKMVMLVNKNFAVSNEFNEFSDFLHTVFETISTNPQKVSNWNKKYNSKDSEKIVDYAFSNLGFCFLNKNSVFEDLILSAKILKPESEFVNSLTFANFYLIE